MNYKNHILVILENDCEDEGREFESFVTKNHPEIEIDYRERTSGVGVGLFDENWNEIEQTFWEDYCNA